MEMEIKALLVDDEEQCVKTLQDGIDWKSHWRCGNFRSVQRGSGPGDHERGNDFLDSLRH